MKRNDQLKPLLGDGPHFAIVPDGSCILPDNITAIRYRADPHTDHRTTIDVIEELRIQIAQNDSVKTKSIPQNVQVPPLRSAHLLFDVLTPGTQQSSQTARAVNSSGQEIEIIIGAGFTDAELPNMQATAMHDIIVGLLCFDTVVLTIYNVGRLHDLLGEDRFWSLFRLGVLEFVNWENTPTIIYPDPDGVAGGVLASSAVHRPDFVLKSTADVVRSQILALPGKEQEAEELLSSLEAKTRLISDAEESSIPATVRSLLLRPSVRRLLGMSEGMPVTSIPRWQMFPVLRLAQVARIGAACRILRIASAKLDFGTSTLAAPVFASTPGREWADNVAAFVVCGSFSANVGSVVLANPQIIDSVLRFRETTTGTELRATILSSLTADEGSEVAVAINSTLKAGLPGDVLQQARDEFIHLSSAPGPTQHSKIALWTDIRSERAIAAWKARSASILESYRSRLKLDVYGQCPCGSGEKLKFCCIAALNERS